MLPEQPWLEYTVQNVSRHTQPGKCLRADLDGLLTRAEPIAPGVEEESARLRVQLVTLARDGGGVVENRTIIVARAGVSKLPVEDTVRDSPIVQSGILVQFDGSPAFEGGTAVRTFSRCSEGNRQSSTARRRMFENCILKVFEVIGLRNF